jgi:hypothetical protein
MRNMLVRCLAALGAAALSFVMFVAPSWAENVLFTYGEMTRLQALPLESAERALSDEEIALYQNFELYAYTVFESLQVANDAAVLTDHEPLFCAPPTVFHFKKEDDIARLADRVTTELIALTKEIGGSLERYDDKPASAVLLLGLRAAFPCDGHRPQLAQR